MVTHIVFFSFKKENKQKHMEEVRSKLESMREDIDVIRDMETGFDFSHKDRAMDMALITRFDDREGLEIYATHPAHLKVIEYINEVVEYTKVVDFEEQDQA